MRRAVPAVRALREAPAGDAAAVGAQRLGRLPGVRRARGCSAAALRRRPGRAASSSPTRRVGALYARALGGVAADVRIPPGEEHKTLGAGRARAARARRGRAWPATTTCVALGGGVVGDVAGFCAAIYQRGVRVVQVPTTLVAQVDSAYGGKTGVDLPEGKNYAGAYHQPAAVLADPARAGDAAAGGAGRRLGRGDQDRADRRRAAVAARARAADARPDRDLVLACARTKLAVVAEDERDGGRRQVLNLGHTVGHAIETATGYAALPPRRGGRPRAARRAHALRPARAARRGRRAARRARAADGAGPGGRPRRRRGGGRRATRSAAAAASASCCVEAPGRRRGPAARVADDELRAALEELRRGEEPRGRPARRQPRRARPPARPSTTAG